MSDEEIGMRPADDGHDFDEAALIELLEVGALAAELERVDWLVQDLKRLVYEVNAWPEPTATEASSRKKKRFIT